MHHPPSTHRQNEQLSRSKMNKNSDTNDGAGGVSNSKPPRESHADYNGTNDNKLSASLSSSLPALAASADLLRSIKAKAGFSGYFRRNDDTAAEKNDSSSATTRDYANIIPSRLRKQHQHHQRHSYPSSSLKLCLKVPSRGARATISASNTKANVRTTAISSSSSSSSSIIISDDIIHHNDRRSDNLRSNSMPTVLLLSDDYQRESVSNMLQMLLNLNHGPSEERATAAETAAAAAAETTATAKTAAAEKERARQVVITSSSIMESSSNTAIKPPPSSFQYKPLLLRRMKNLHAAKASAASADGGGGGVKKGSSSESFVTTTTMAVLRSYSMVSTGSTVDMHRRGILKKKSFRNDGSSSGSNSHEVVHNNQEWSTLLDSSGTATPRRQFFQQPTAIGDGGWNVGNGRVQSSAPNHACSDGYVDRNQSRSVVSSRKKAAVSNETDDGLIASSQGGYTGDPRGFQYMRNASSVGGTIDNHCRPNKASNISSRNAVVSNETTAPLASATASGTGEREGFLMTRQLQYMRIASSSDEVLYDASIKPSPPQVLSASSNQSSSNNDNVIIAVHDPGSRRFSDYSNNNINNTSAAATAGQLLVDWGDHASGGGSSSSLDTASARTSTSEEQQLAGREKNNNDNIIRHHKKDGNSGDGTNGKTGWPLWNGVREEQG